MNVTGTQGKEMVQVSAVVTRCGCTESQRQSPSWHGKQNRTCPTPSRIQDKGVVAYWHRNPLRRIAFRLRALLGTR